MDTKLKVLTDTDWLKNKKVVEKKMLELIQEWKIRVGIPHWTLEVTFDEEVPMASCAVSENYLAAQLNFNPIRVKNEIDTNFDLEELVVHELTHIPCWDISIMCERIIIDECEEMERQREKMEERMVTLLARGMVMSKYRLDIIPDSFTAKLAGTDWEELYVVTDGGEHELRGTGHS